MRRSIGLSRRRDHDARARHPSLEPASTIAWVAPSILGIDPRTTTPIDAGLPSEPYPSSRNVETTPTGCSDSTTSSRSRSSRYQPSPMSPRSEASVTTPATRARWPLEASRSSASVAMTELGAPGAHARSIAPPSPRSTVPVMPCWLGRPPVPIVVSVAAGSTGSEPVLPSIVPASRIRERRNGQASGCSSRALDPTPFQTISTIEGIGDRLRHHCSRRRRAGVPARTSGCGAAIADRLRERRCDLVQSGPGRWWRAREPRPR